MNLPFPRAPRTRLLALAVAGAIAMAVSVLSVPHAGAAARGPTSAGPGAEELAAIEAGYACPMHPQIVSSHPDHCPICGMDLEKSAAHGAGHVHAVASEALSNLGVRVVEAQGGPVEQVLHTWGTVVPDEQALFQVSTKFDGWLRELSVHAVGERVEKGQVLYRIYSPDLVAKEREFFQFLARRKQVLQAVGDVSQQENEYVMDLLRDLQKEREDFLRRDVPIEVVERLEQYGATIEVVEIQAQRSGIVTQINAREGAFVSPAMPILMLSDPDKVWVDVVLPAARQDRVRRGDPATLRTTDGNALEAKLDFVSPLLDGGRGRARIPASGASAALRLGDLVTVDIRSSGHAAVTVPASAVLRTGHGAWVMLARDDGSFVPVDVETGIEASDRVEITGLKAGARVASNAQFLFDPSSSLEDAQARHEPVLAASSH